ncbi:MAG: 23S rRNA (uracil(1939)-C(5))-methyltransferase RlmD [Christensenellaceae bacterium]|nr:23S rRNA (uracil(1939)-C(5))-methyltransferase RlmD [Christensenellaceae bacterium]
MDISDIGCYGEGIGHYQEDGYVYTVFVPFTLKGETVKVKVEFVNRKKGLVFAKFIGISNASVHRITPECPYYKKCGNCNFQHVAYPEELNIKKGILTQTLTKSGMHGVNIDDIVPSNVFKGCRNKLILHFGIVKGQIALGFYASKSHDLVPIENCIINGDWSGKLIKILTDYANAIRLTVYNEETETGLLRSVVIRNIDGFISLTVVVNGIKLPQSDKLEKAIRAEFPRFALFFSPNKRKTNVVLENFVKVIGGTDEEVSIDKLPPARVSPLSFLQVNDDIRRKLYDFAIEKTKGSRNVLDAYAGRGMLGLHLLQKYSEANITNVEIIEDAVREGLAAASKLNLEERVRFFAGDSTKILGEVLELVKPETVILDPPEGGISRAEIETLNRDTRIKKIIYISCNPATLGANAAGLAAFEPVSVTPFDMFPRTFHLETVMVLVRAH